MTEDPEDISTPVLARMPEGEPFAIEPDLDLLTTDERGAERPYEARQS